MVLAIEPMTTAGAPDGAASATTAGRSTRKDGSLAAHFEFTVAITADGPARPDALAPSTTRQHAGAWLTLCGRARVS